jgi:hypothetical protein
MMSHNAHSNRTGSTPSKAALAVECAVEAALLMNDCCKRTSSALRCLHVHEHVRQYISASAACAKASKLHLFTMIMQAAAKVQQQHAGTGSSINCMQHCEIPAYISTVADMHITDNLKAVTICC